MGASRVVFSALCACTLARAVVRRPDSTGSGAVQALPDFRDAPPKQNRQLMTNYGDIEYVTYFTVGGQTISGIIDTGSFELVVFSTECKPCGGAAKYDPKRSHTHKTGLLMTVQSYGSGDTYSWEASDMVSVGPFHDQNQTFWEVVDAKMPILRTAAFQAIVGVGPPETPAADAWGEVQRTLNNINHYFQEGKHPPEDVTQNAKEAIDAAMDMSESPTMLDTFGIKTFSLCLGAAPGSDGFFVWQDAAPVQKSHLFTRITVLGKHTWTVQLGNVRLTRSGSLTDTKLGCHNGASCSALVDSGTSLLAMPQSVIQKVQDTVDSMNLDCKNLGELPNLVFELGGKLLSLPPDAYVAEAEGTVPNYLQGVVRMRNVSAAGSKCRVLLMESYMDSKDGPLWIFGMPFFRKYYTSFHVGDDQRKRALHVAEANEECEPSEGASLARVRPVRRRIDVSRLHAPPILRKSGNYVNV